MSGAVSRFLLWFSLLLCAVIVVIGASLQTAWLRDQILTFALDAGTARWSLDATEGRLLTGIVLEGLELEVADVAVSIGRLEVRPALGRMLFGQIALKAILVDDLDVKLPEALPDGDPDAGPADIRLPLPIVLDGFALRGFRLTQGDSEVLRDMDLALSLSGRNQTLDIEHLQLRWPEQGLLVSGRGHVNLDPLHAFGATLDVVRSDPAGEIPSLGARLNAVGSLEQVGLQARLSGAATGTLIADWNLTANRGRVRGAITAVNFDGLPPELQWQRLTFDAEGSPDALAWDIAFDAAWEAMQPRLRAHGSLLDDEQGLRLQLDHAELRLDANAVELSGALDLSAPFAFQAELGATDLDLSPWLDDFPTRLDLTTNMDGQIGSEADQRRVDLRHLAVSGSWNEAPARLRASANASWPGNELALTLDRFELDLGDNQVVGRGTLTDTLNFDLDLALDDLSQMWPGAAGTVRGNVAARGTPAAPDLTLNLDMHELAFDEVRLARAEIGGRLSPDPATPTRLRADVTGLASGGLLLDATADVYGNWPQLSAEMTVDLPAAELAATAEATADVAELRSVKVQTLTIEQRLGGRFELEDTLEISRSGETPEVLRFSRACLVGDGIGQPSLCVATGRMDEQGLRLDATLTDLALESFAILVPEWLHINGALQGRAEVRGTDLDVSLTVDGGRFRVLDLEDEDEVFADEFSTLNLDLSRRGSQLEATLTAEAALAGSLGFTGRLELLPDTPLEDAPLTGSLRLDVADLTPFGPLIPGTASTGGTLNGELAISGRVGDPELGGSLELAGRTEVPALALELDPVTLSVQSVPGQPLVLRGQVYAGSQVLDIDAEADWDRTTGLVASGRLHGDALPLAALPDLNLTLSPDLRFTLDDTSIRLDGSATIPDARARIRALPQGGGDTLSQDVVIHRTAGEEVAARQRDLYLNLSVILGSNVHLAAAGLETRLTGRLQLLESPGSPLTARGRLETREGSFNAYGQELELRTGRLNFDGPLDNPAVDVLAVRRVNGSEVGVQVGGFLDALETRLYSSPAREDVETLTMLITGRMPGDASSAELANVSDAALNFGIGQAVPVVGRLVNRLGIDELAVDSPLDEDAGAVIVGTRLTDDIYVRYTYGLHSRLGGLQIEYRVTDWLSIQSETGTTQAIDLIFRREFN
ncbi:MAG: translocation/assembly module TamB domain-containing protein [Gammaproteobacteria bacterium]|nr:translocation/assembly module TamB domain-containing protein [Gammaproteobacteria bacterium]